MDAPPSKSTRPPPHVIIFPFPLQGHVNSMLKLAELLALASIRITFINSEHNQHCLLRHADLQARFAVYEGFRFRTISDGLPADHSRALSGEDGSYMTTFNYIKSITKPLFEELVPAAEPLASCIIADGLMSFAIDVAREVGVPIISFRTISACCFWVYFCIPRMIESAELPIKGDEDMDRVLTSVPAMEHILRCRDLPSFCRVDDVSDTLLRHFTAQTLQTTQAQGLILNTFDHLEGPAISHIRDHCPNLYTIGPLHSHLNSRLSSGGSSSLSKSTTTSNSLRKIDRTCITWLDKQPSRSVIYVSFGSLAILKRSELMEFWHGLVNSKKRFLWVVRPDSVVASGGEGDDDGNNNVPAELREATAERGHLVEWAPQEEVLRHDAVAGFLTHSGWNSTLESVVTRKPMICWPYFADQQVNSRFVSRVWGVGMDMKDKCDRAVVEAMVNDLMAERRKELATAAAELGKAAAEAVAEGGSSWANLDRLIEDIRSMTMGARE